MPQSLCKVCQVHTNVLRAGPVVCRWVVSVLKPTVPRCVIPLSLSYTCINVDWMYSQSRGGAIVNYGSLDLLGGSLFLTNFADSAGDGGTGGGIHNGEGGIVT